MNRVLLSQWWPYFSLLFYQKTTEPTKGSEGRSKRSGPNVCPTLLIIITNESVSGIKESFSQSSGGGMDDTMPWVKDYLLLLQ